jgi:hypothetical protein
MFLVSSSKTTKSQNPHSVVVGIFSQEKLEHRVIANTIGLTFQ